MRDNWKINLKCILNLSSTVWPKSLVQFLLYTHAVLNGQDFIEPLENSNLKLGCNITSILPNL